MFRKEDIPALTKEQMTDDRMIQDLKPVITSGNGDYQEIRRMLVKRATELRCAVIVKQMLADAEKAVKEQQAEARRRKMMEQMVNEDGVNLMQFMKVNDKGEIVGIDQNAVYEHLKKHVHIMVYSRKPYIYKDGVYILDNAGAKTGAEIQTEIGKLIFGSYRTAKLIKDIYSRVEQDAELIVTRANSHPKSWINFRNGFYDVKEKKWHDHDPKYFSLNQIPWEYHPEQDEKGDMIEDFLNYALYRENAKELFLEFAGCAMTPNGNFQNFLMFTGQGGNGKSVLIKLFDALVGAKNLTHLSLSDISSNRFSTARLVGKLANSCGDLKTESVKDCQRLKMATGGDAMTGEYKGVDSFEFDSYAKLLFSINEIPKILGEDSDAIFRRMMVLTVDRKPQKADINLSDKLMKQMPYFLKLCVEACERLYERGAFVECPDSIINVENARTFSNSVDAFLMEKCEREAGYRLKRKDLYEEYEKFCKDEGKVPKAKTQFYEVLRNKGFGEIKTKGERYIVGLTMKLEDNEEELVVKEETVPEFGPMQMKLVERAKGQMELQKVDPNEVLEKLEQLKRVQEQINQQIEMLTKQLLG